MLESALKKMSTNDYSTQIQGVDESLLVVNKVFSEIVRILSEADDSLFIAERISSVFESLKRNLESTFNSTDNIDLKVNIAIIYLTNNDYTKVPFLLNYLKETADIGNATFCLMKLASKSVHEAKPLIKEWIQKIEIMNINETKRRDYLQMLEDAYSMLTDQNEAI